MRRLMLLALMGLFVTTPLWAEEPIPQVTEAMIVNDCHVAGALAVELMTHRASESPEQLAQRAEALLTRQGYHGALGDAYFLAVLYTQTTLDLDPQEIEQISRASKEDLELAALNHEIECVSRERKKLAPAEKAPEKK